MLPIKTSKSFFNINKNISHLIKLSPHVHYRQHQLSINSNVYQDFKYNISPTRAINSNLPNIEPWQQKKLELAFFTRNRHKLRIQDLSLEVGLRRQDVLAWVKEFWSLSDKTKKSILKARTDEWELSEERQKYLEKMSEKKKEKEKEMKNYITEKWIKDKQREVEKVKFGKMTPKVIDMLEHVYKKTRHPTEKTLRELFEIYKVPRWKAIKWFSDKRKNDRFVEQEFPKILEKKKNLNN